MKRRWDWDTRLATFVMLMYGRAFRWGETDCGQVCFGAIDAMCGTRIAPELAARYRCQWSAYRLQVKEGINVGSVLEGNGAQRISAALVRRGDIVLHPASALLAGHVVLSDLCLTSRPDYGVRIAYTREALGQPGAFVLRVA